MKPIFLRTRIILSVIMTLWLLLAGTVFGDIEDVIEKSFEVGENGLLTVNSDVGSIEVQAEGSNRVDVKVYLKADAWSKDEAKAILEDFVVDFDQSGNDVAITGKFKSERRSDWGRKGRRLNVQYVIAVPVRYNVDLNTAGGSISVADLEGKALSKTSGGSLTFGHIKGPVTGKTSGGSINLKGCEGPAEIKTSGGSISIGEVNGNVTAKTSGGSVSIARAKGNVIAGTSGGSITVEEVMGDIDASTSGGSVTAHISRQPEGNCRLTTSGGNVTVYLDDDIGVNLDAQTSGGSVHTDFKVTVQGKLQKTSLQAEINGGGPELLLRTSGGSIYVKKKQDE